MGFFDFLNKNKGNISSTHNETSKTNDANTTAVNEAGGLQKAKLLYKMGGHKDEILKLLMQERNYQEKTRFRGACNTRTESAWRYYKDLLRTANNDPDVFGFQWVLSTAHKDKNTGCDCEFYATVDLGYGPGVFPKSVVPLLPAHSDCMCHLREIFVWEVEDESFKKIMKRDS